MEKDKHGLWCRNGGSVIDMSEFRQQLLLNCYRQSANRSVAQRKIADAGMPTAKAVEIGITRLLRIIVGLGETEFRPTAVVPMDGTSEGGPNRLACPAGKENTAVGSPPWIRVIANVQSACWDVFFADDQLVTRTVRPARHLRSGRLPVLHVVTPIRIRSRISRRYKRTKQGGHIRKCREITVCPIGGNVSSGRIINVIRGTTNHDDGVIAQRTGRKIHCITGWACEIVHKQADDMRPSPPSGWTNVKGNGTECFAVRLLERSGGIDLIVIRSAFPPTAPIFGYSCAVTDPRPGRISRYGIFQFQPFDSLLQGGLLNERVKERPERKSSFSVRPYVNVGRRQSSSCVVKIVDRETELFQVIGTLSSSGCLPCGLNRRQKKSDQDTNDRNDDEKFDKGEAASFT